MSNTRGAIKKVAALRACTQSLARDYCENIQEVSEYCITIKEIAEALQSLIGKEYGPESVALAAREVRLSQNRRKDVRKGKKKRKSQLTKLTPSVQSPAADHRRNAKAAAQAIKPVFNVGDKDGPTRLHRLITRILHEARSSFQRASNLLSNELIEKWLASALPNVPCRDCHLSSTGSDPFSIDDVGALLQSVNMPIYELEQHTDVLIIGRSGWREAELNRLLDQRIGKKLKVYSQEMFLVHWASTCDPFEDEDVVRDFGIGHPALEFLTSRWYAWPSTDVSLDSGGGLQFDSPEVGVLRSMGYRVGKSGCPADQRLKILAQAFTSHLPFVDSNAYMRKWGKPKSIERLKKLADSIASFCCNQQRLGNVEAAADYEHDLDWLERNFYRGRFRFKWPKARVI